MFHTASTFVSVVTGNATLVLEPPLLNIKLYIVVQCLGRMVRRNDQFSGRYVKQASVESRKLQGSRLTTPL